MGEILVCSQLILQVDQGAQCPKLLKQGSNVSVWCWKRGDGTGGNSSFVVPGHASGGGSSLLDSLW